MANADVLKEKDDEFDTQQASFISGITTNAALWGLDPLLIPPLVSKQTLWAAAWLADKTPATKNELTTQAKKDARKAYEAVLRPYIQTKIRGNTLMADADLVSIGIKPLDTTRTAASLILDVPAVDAQPGQGTSVDVYFSQEPDEDGKTRRGMPDGVIRCEFVYTVGDAPPNPEACNKNATATKSPLNLSFSPEQSGQRVYIYARWINSANQPAKNWSLRKSCIIPGI